MDYNENLQRKLWELRDKFDSSPISRSKLSSNTDFLEDVSCACGWTLSFSSIKDKYKIIERVRQHYAKRKTLVTSRKLRAKDDAHSLFGFHLEGDNITYHKETSILNWAVPSSSLPPPPLSPPRPPRWEPTPATLEPICQQTEEEVNAKHNQIVDALEETENQTAEGTAQSVEEMTETFLDQKRIPEWIKKLEKAQAEHKISGFYLPRVLSVLTLR